jgi:hypothetical protein
VKRRLATLLKGKVPEVDQPDLFSDADSVGFDMGTVAGGSDAADDLPEVLTMAAE